MPFFFDQEGAFWSKADRSGGGESLRKIAAEYSISHTLVYHIQIGKRWSSVTKHEH